MPWTTDISAAFWTRGTPACCAARLSPEMAASRCVGGRAGASFRPRHPARWGRVAAVGEHPSTMSSTYGSRRRCNHASVAGRPRPLADDVVIVVEQESDAHRVLEVPRNASGGLGLTMHPEKSRLVRFAGDRAHQGLAPEAERVTDPATRHVRLPGVRTHYWCIGWNRSWVLKRKTAKPRRSLTAVRSR